MCKIFCLKGLEMYVSTKYSHDSTRAQFLDESRSTKKFLEKTSLL